MKSPILTFHPAAAHWQLFMMVLASKISLVYTTVLNLARFVQMLKKVCSFYKSSGDVLRFMLLANPMPMIVGYMPLPMLLNCTWLRSSKVQLGL